MKCVLEKEAYAKFDKEAKAKGTTTRLLAAEILTKYVNALK